MMPEALELWLEFALAAAIIVFAGIRLSRYGDVIAEKTGLGRTWIGVLLMAAVTSLPELITGASSVTSSTFRTSPWAMFSEVACLTC